MNVRDLLRASLIPLGAALVMRGLQDLRDTADELGQLVDERRAYLAGDGPLPDVDEHQDDEQTPAPEDLPHTADLENAGDGRFPARAMLAGVAGVIAGVIAGRAAARWAHRAELAAVARDVAVVVAKNDELLAEQRRAAVDEHQDVELPEPCANPCTRAQLCTYPLCVLPAAGDDEHQDVDDRIAAADQDYAAPYGCPHCSHVEPVRPGDVPGSRAVRIALHRNRHQRGLVGG